MGYFKLEHLFSPTFNGVLFFLILANILKSKNNEESVKTIKHQTLCGENIEKSITIEHFQVAPKEIVSPQENMSSVRRTSIS